MGTPLRRQHGANRPVLAKELSYRLEQEQGRRIPPQPDCNGDKRQVSEDSIEEGNRQSSQASILEDGTHASPHKVMPSRQAWHLYFTQEIDMNWMLSGQMYCLTFATGLLDVNTYKAFGVFSTKMTGNLLLLAVDALDSSAALDYNVLTAICCFIVGAAAFGHIGRLVGRRRRLFLLVSNILQTALVFAATAIEHYGVDVEHGVHAVLRIALLAFAMAGQVSLAIGVGLPDLNTTMITASLIQLCYDPHIFRRRNKARTRRIAFILVMIAGHFMGAVCSLGGVAVGLVATAGVKALVTLSFLFNPGIVPNKTDGEHETASPESGTVTPARHVLWGD